MKTLGIRAVWLTVVVIMSQGHALAGTATNRITLKQALERARQKNPSLQAVRQRISEAKGDLAGASILLRSNPQAEAAVGARILPSKDSSTEFEVGLSQQFEIGGQRGHRINRAKALASAMRASAADAERLLSLSVAGAFFDAIAASERVRLTEETRRLTKELYDFSSRRVARGASAPVALNGARIRLASASRKVLQAKTKHRITLVRLVRLLGLKPGTKIEPVGKLPSASSLPALSQLAKKAAAERPDFIALQRRLEAARHDAKLASASAWPDLTAGVRYGREEQSHIVVGALSIPLPFFNRNQGRRQSSEATVRRLQAEQRAVKATVSAQVRGAYARFSAAKQALALYNAQVLDAQKANLRLILTMFKAGKINYAEVVLLQRELLEGRLGYLGVRQELATAEAAVRSAAGLPLVSLTGGVR